MGLFSILDVSAAALDVQQTKLALTTSNLANANTTRSADGSLFTPQTAVVRSTQAEASADIAFAGSARPFVAEIADMQVPPRRVHDPGHPDADPQGFVTLPGVDPLALMLDLMSISREYEANLRAFDVTRSLLQRTLDIGARR